MKLIPELVYRREFDGTGLLFNSADGASFILNPTTAIICGCLEKGTTLPEILREMATHLRNLPPQAEQEVTAFLQTLRQHHYLLDD